MALIVRKYGGTSVADCEKIERVAAKALECQRAGNQVVLVLSAMSGETNKLIGFAHKITDRPNLREMDALMATGEQVTVALCAIAIEKMGGKAKSFLGDQVPILTSDAHTKARILDIPADRLRTAMDSGYIPVVAGFQGVTSGGDITTLGRGGSDTTAVALAAALKADVCEIYTDVDGVYTTDPNMCPKAQKIDRISYEEMLEMASLGAKVLEIRSVAFAMRYNVPVHVLSSFTHEPGTIVTKEDESMEERLISAVTYSKNEARITISRVPDRPGIAASIFKPITDANIVVDMIIQNTRAGDMTDMTFTIPRTDYPQAMEIVEKVAKEIGAERVTGSTDIAKVSIVGVGMRNHAGVASQMFDILSKHGINILMISTSEIKISCVIEEKYTELAVRALHEGFGLDADVAP